MSSLRPFAKRLPSFNSRYHTNITVTDLEMIMIAQENTCAICGTSLFEFLNDWEIDHIVSVKNGGLSNVDNIQLVCQPCNRGKWTMSTDEYIRHCLQVPKFMQARKAGARVPKK